MYYDPSGHFDIGLGQYLKDSYNGFSQMFLVCDEQRKKNIQVLSQYAVEEDSTLAAVSSNVLSGVQDASEGLDRVQNNVVQKGNELKTIIENKEAEIKQSIAEIPERIRLTFQQDEIRNQQKQMVTINYNPQILANENPISNTNQLGLNGEDAEGINWIDTFGKPTKTGSSLTKFITSYYINSKIAPGSFRNLLPFQDGKTLTAAGQAEEWLNNGRSGIRLKRFVPGSKTVAGARGILQNITKIKPSFATASKSIPLLNALIESQNSVENYKYLAEEGNPFLGTVAAFGDAVSFGIARGYLKTPELVLPHNTAEAYDNYINNTVSGINVSNKLGNLWNRIVN